MRVSFFLLLLLFAASTLFAQDTSWREIKVDENLRISLPSQLSRIDTVIDQKGQKMHFKLLTGKTGDNTVILTVTPEATNINADNPETLKEGMKGIKRGMQNSIVQKGLYCTFKDTVVDKLTCVKALIYAKAAVNPNMFYYIFLVNDKMYSVAYTLPQADSAYLAKNDLDRLLMSIHFNKASIKEQRFPSKADSLGYKFGFALGGFMVLALLAGAIFLIVYFVRKNNK